MKEKSQIFCLEDVSIHDAVTDVWAGVMDKVSGLRLISCKDGTMRILSSGWRLRRSRKPAAMVEMARRRLEQRSLEGGDDGSPRRIEMVWNSGSLERGGFFRKLPRSLTWERPNCDSGES